MNIKYSKDNDFYNKELFNYDIIFNGDRVGGDISPLNIDNAYNIVDYKLYAFSTMGKNVKMMNSRNMVLPIREKNAIKHPLTYGVLLENLNTTKPEDGIFIVEYYNFNAVTTISEESNLYHYYQYIDNLKYSKRTIDMIRDYIHDVSRLPGMGNLVTSSGMRIITFVPEHELLEHQLVYSSATDLLLVLGDVNETTQHPKNLKKDTSSHRPVMHTNDEMLVSIELVNHETNMPKWINIGNEVVKVLPVNRPDKPNGGTIAIKRNGATIFNKSVDTEELSSIGLYDTKDTATSNNDPQLLLAKQELVFKEKELEYKYTKLVTEKEQLEIDLMNAKNKLEYEKEKYDNEIKKIELEFDNKLKLMDLDIDRIVFTDNLNYNKEMKKYRHDSIKHEYELEAARLNVAKAKIGLRKAQAETLNKLVGVIGGFF